MGAPQTPPLKTHLMSFTSKGTIFREAKISKLRARYKLPASSHACQLHLRTLSATVECAAVKTGVGQKCHPYALSTAPRRPRCTGCGSRVFHLSSHAATPTQTAKDDGPDAFHLHIYRTGIGRACNLLSRIILHEQDHEVRGLASWPPGPYRQDSPRQDPARRWRPSFGASTLPPPLEPSAGWSPCST